MNITDQQKETVAAEATKIFIQDPAWEFFQRKEILNVTENGEDIFNGSLELIIARLSLQLPLAE